MPGVRPLPTVTVGAVNGTPSGKVTAAPPEPEPPGSAAGGIGTFGSVVFVVSTGARPGDAVRAASEGWITKSSDPLVSSSSVRPGSRPLPQGPPRPSRRCGPVVPSRRCPSRSPRLCPYPLSRSWPPSPPRCESPPPRREFPPPRCESPPPRRESPPPRCEPPPSRECPGSAATTGTAAPPAINNAAIAPEPAATQSFCRAKVPVRPGGKRRISFILARSPGHRPQFVRWPRDLRQIRRQPSAPIPAPVWPTPRSRRPGRTRV